MRMLLTLLLLCALSSQAQSTDVHVGDDYARAALRAVIAGWRGIPLHGPSLDRLVYLLDEADIEARTPAEENSVAELNRITTHWGSDIAHDHVCYLALKKALRNRDGATPDECKAATAH
jgi:hypothetical protein